MADLFPPAKQRPRLLEFREAIEARHASVRRDECSDWAIFGKFGHAYAVPEGFQLVIVASSVRQWSADKKRLSFCRLTQDGDDEGCLILGRLPAESEAELIRDVLGIPKARHLSEDHPLRAHSYRVGGRFQPAPRPTRREAGLRC